MLIRHGEYNHSIPPHGLTSRGIEQARAAGTRLGVLLTSRVVITNKIIHSGLQRARQTAEVMSQALANPLLLEEDASLNEGQPAEVRCTLHNVYRGCVCFNNQFYYVLLKDNERFERAFNNFFYRSDSLEGNVLVCHANIIRYFVCRLVKWIISDYAGSCA